MFLGNIFNLKEIIKRKKKQDGDDQNHLGVFMNSLRQPLAGSGKIPAP